MTVIIVLKKKENTQAQNCATVMQVHPQQQTNTTIHNMHGQRSLTVMTTQPPLQNATDFIYFIFKRQL